jgi:hypothetical protein
LCFGQKPASAADTQLGQIIREATTRVFLKEATEGTFGHAALENKAKVSSGAPPLNDQRADS